MSETHDPEQAIGTVTHYFSHLSVAAVSLKEPLAIGERIHIRGHTSDVAQTVESMEVEHHDVERAGPGDDVALRVADHVREHDLVYRDSLSPATPPPGRWAGTARSKRSSAAAEQIKPGYAWLWTTHTPQI